MSKDSSIETADINLFEAVESPRIESLFSVAVVAAQLRGAGNPDTLFPAERVGQEKWAAKRVSEFAAGRRCAHHAMLRLGIAAAPLLARPDRRPQWPAGVVGSITHCKDFCAAVVARETGVLSLGLDAEACDAVEPHLWPRVLNTDEFTWLHTKPEHERRLWATVVFSAKEAFYKCQFGVTGHWLEFRDAHVDIELRAGELDDFDLVVRGKDVTLQGRGCICAGTVCTGFAWPVSKPCR